MLLLLQEPPGFDGDRSLDFDFPALSSCASRKLEFMQILNLLDAFFGSQLLALLSGPLP